MNADAMTAVLAKLKAAGLAGDAIQTTGYDIQPEFDYTNGKQTLRGYVARNSIEVRVDDLPKLGDILDIAVGAGATSVAGRAVRSEGSERRRARGAAAGGRGRARARQRRGRRCRHEGRADRPDRGAARHGRCRRRGR